VNYPLFKRLCFVCGTAALTIATSGFALRASGSPVSSESVAPVQTAASDLDLESLEVSTPVAPAPLYSQSTGGTGQNSGDEPAQSDPTTGSPGSGTTESDTTERDRGYPVSPSDTTPEIQDRGQSEQTPTDLNPAEPGLNRPDNSVPETNTPNRTNPVILDSDGIDSDSIDSDGVNSDGIESDGIESDTAPDSTTPNLSPNPTIPNSTTPDTTPNSTEPDAGRNSPTSQADPDRTPPGTFTPDTRDISPGRATRSGSSYVGVGGNIGLGDGDTALGEGSFSIFSKVGLTRNLSVRPNVLVSDDPTILLPLTLDFIPLVTEVTEDVSREIGLRVSPFIGAGVAISTGDDSTVDFLATGGVDVPLSSRITATASVNATLFDNPAVGLLLGVGYNF
jgi:hypothetical protein